LETRVFSCAVKIRDKENLFNAAESPQNGAYFPSFLGLLKRTSEFDARTTPKQTQVLDRTASPAKLLSP
jgi:hypothetical protein